MFSFFEALWTNPLLFSALLAGIFASFVAGIVGSYVVVKRIVFISGGISHAVLSGIGFCLWLERTRGVTWASPLYGAVLTSIIAALIIGRIHLSYRQREDSVIAAIWAIGMAIGVLFIAKTPGYGLDLSNFLIGNILWVSRADLTALFVLDVFVGVIAVLLHHRFVAICFDEQQAKLQGLNVNRLYMLLLVLTAVSTVLLMQVVGIALVMTMLSLPALVANLFTRHLPTMMVLAVFLSIGFCVSGMALSFHLDWPSGATIVMVAGVVYITCLLWRRNREYV